MKVKFTIPGEPQGKGRHRMGNGVTYTPDKTVVYENLIKLMYRQQCRNYRFPDKTMLDMRIVAYYAIPKSASKKKQEEMRAFRLRPMKKVDWDNLGKTVSDALNQIAYRDDTQIVDAQVRKFYSDNPRVVVTIQDVNPPMQQISIQE